MTTAVNIAGQDGGGHPVTFRADQNGDNSLAMHMVPETGGASVGPTNGLPTTAANRVPLGYQQITALGTFEGLTVPAGATQAWLIAEGSPLRWRDDGVAPTATVGMPLPTWQPFLYVGSLAAIKFIQENTGGVLNVSYY